MHYLPDMPICGRVKQVGHKSSLHPLGKSFARGAKPANLSKPHTHRLMTRKRNELIEKFGVRIRVAKDDILPSGGDPTQQLFIVEDGDFQVTLPVGSDDLSIAKFGAGACFTFDFADARGAICRATSSGEVIKIPLRRLQGLGSTPDAMLHDCHAFEMPAFLEACYPVSVVQPIMAKQEPAIQINANKQPQSVDGSKIESQSPLKPTVSPNADHP